MRFRVALELGRVSNLLTVLSNASVGLLLVGQKAWPVWCLVLGSMALSYCGGMFLNDYFDASFDEKYKSDRPIASGRVTRNEVQVWGLMQLGLAVVLLGLAASAPTRGILAGLVLSLLILMYNVWHKQNPLSPVVMGLCRVMVVIGAAATIEAAWLSEAVLEAAVLIFLHVVGLTYAARGEHLSEPQNSWPLFVLSAPVLWLLWQLPSTGAEDRVGLLIALAALALVNVLAIKRLLRRGPGDVPTAVGQLIAALCLLDAALLAHGGYVNFALLSAAGYPMTTWLQRRISGT